MQANDYIISPHHVTKWVCVLWSRDNVLVVMWCFYILSCDGVVFVHVVT